MKKHAFEDPAQPSLHLAARALGVVYYTLVRICGRRWGSGGAETATLRSDFDVGVGNT